MPQNPQGPFQDPQGKERHYCGEADQHNRKGSAFDSGSRSIEYSENYLGKAEIKVKVNADRDLAEFKGLTYIEVMGIVEPGNDDVIQMTEYTDFKDNFGKIAFNTDLKVYNEVVKISN